MMSVLTYVQVHISMFVEVHSCMHLCSMYVLHASKYPTRDGSARTVNKYVNFSKGLHNLLEGGRHNFLALPDIY